MCARTTSPSAPPTSRACPPSSARSSRRGQASRIELERKDTSTHLEADVPHDASRQILLSPGADVSLTFSTAVFAIGQGVLLRRSPKDQTAGTMHGFDPNI